MRWRTTRQRRPARRRRLSPPARGLRPRQLRQPGAAGSSPARSIGFEWRHTFWIPLFQFTEELEVKPGLKAVLAELASEYDGRRLAEWFVEPNGWLEERRPIDVLDANPDEVLQAARADRFVATG
jgi:hypothetical protein